MSLLDWVSKCGLRDELLAADDEDAEESSVQPLFLLAFAAMLPKQQNALPPPLRSLVRARQALYAARRARPPHALMGLPPRPLVERLQLAVAQWGRDGTASQPPEFFPGLFSEEQHPPLPRVSSEAEAVSLLTEARIFCLLQMRRTAGTREGRLPPSRGQLLRFFRAAHAKKGKAVALTVGGRALTKHAQRCSQAWWGEASGPAAVINARAECAIRRILNEAVWLNIHILPPNLPVFEARVAEGYGARWTQEDGGEWTFRGYLEPPNPEGHEKGWKH